MATVTIGNGNTTVNEGILTGSTLNVGNGNDTITVAGSADRVTVGKGNDTIAAAGLSHSLITAGNGNDAITAGSSDAITAGNGGDTITASGSDNTITVGKGADTITATGSSDRITVGNGNDTIAAAGLSHSLITAGNGNDAITAGSSDAITAGNGGDTITVSGSDDTITVGKGADTITATGSSDRITVGNGNDTIAAAGLSHSLITAGNGNDAITAGSSDAITAGNGGDRITASGSDDTITVGKGADTITATGSSDRITVGNGNDTIAAAGLSHSLITVGKGSDTISAGSDDEITVGSGNDAISAGIDDTITVDNGSNTTISGSDDTIIADNGSAAITLAAGSTDDAITIGGGSHTLAAGGLSGSSIAIDGGINTITVNGAGDTIAIDGGINTIIANGAGDRIAARGGIDTITANGAGDTITADSGRYTIIANGIDDTITVGNANASIAAGATASITIGDGNDTVSAGANSTIGPGPNHDRDNGNDTVTAGPASTIDLGDGRDIVLAEANSTIAVGNGADAIYAGTADTIGLGFGRDTIAYTDLTLQFTVPSSLSVTEYQDVALPIVLGPPALGREVVTGFNPSLDVIALDTADFANYGVVKADASQVGANTVITLDPGDTITLQDVALSSLSARNFAFSGALNETITLSGIPNGSSLSAGTNDGNGTWTLTPAQLAGLQFDAGPATTADLTATVTDSAGQAGAASQSIPLEIYPAAADLSISVLPAEAGDPATLTRLEVTATVPYADDYLKSISFSGVPAGDTLSANGLVGSRIPINGAPGSSFSTEVDVSSPSDTTSTFFLGVNAFSGATGSPEMVTAHANQPIFVAYDPVSQAVDFNAVKQSIWGGGTSPTFTFQKFVGITTSAAGGKTIGSPSTASLNINGSFALNTGFEATVALNSGSFNATLPFNLTLGATYNHENDTLEVDPTAAQAAGSKIMTTGPGGSFGLDFIFDAMAKASVGASILGVGTKANVTVGPFSATVPILHFSSSTTPVGLLYSFDNQNFSFAWPTLDTEGTGGSGTISASGISNPFFSVTADPIALAFAALDLPDPFSFKSGPFTLSLLSVMLGAGLDLAQTFSLNASLPTATLTPLDGPPQTLTFNSTKPLIIDNAPNEFTLNLTPNATLENNTGIVGALEAALTEGTVSIDKLGLSIGPLFSISTNVPLGTPLSVYNHTFPVTFNPQTISSIKVG